MRALYAASRSKASLCSRTHAVSRKWPSIVAFQVRTGKRNSASRSHGMRAVCSPPSGARVEDAAAEEELQRDVAVATSASMYARPRPPGRSARHGRWATVAPVKAGTTTSCAPT